MEDLYRKVRERLARAERVGVLTGAGVSAESGVPTFRGAGGLWHKFDVMKLATPEGFREDPKKVWEFYDTRRQMMLECEPNPAHYAIAALERQVPEFLLITQNIDGLHARAGSKKIAEMHGSIWKVRPEDDDEPVLENREVPLKELPLYDNQGRLLRPAVVWFGEMLPESQLAKMQNFLEFPPDVLIVAGTSSLISWVQMVIIQARQGGSFLVEVNLEETDLTHLADVTLTGKAGEVLPRLVEAE